VTSERGGQEGPLAEFVALRQEIERRSMVQHGLFVLQLTSAGAIFSFAISGAGHSGFLLIIPISTYMLCARYVEQQYGTQRAAIYIKDELSNRISGGLGWEAWQVQHTKFVRGSIIRRINALIIMFPTVGAAALVWTTTSALGRHIRLDGSERAGLDAVWILGLIAVVMSIQMIWSMLRHPLGDATLPPLYRLPVELNQPANSTRAAGEVSSESAGSAEERGKPVPLQTSPES
jgi:hypothetical protein